MSQDVSHNRTSVNGVDRLIAANLARSVAAYGVDGGKIGTVSSFLVDKTTGRVAYAVLSLGGFLGLGQSYHPLPWELLIYDPARGGYAISVGKEMLEGSPGYRLDDAPEFDDVYGQRISTYYGISKLGN